MEDDLNEGQPQWKTTLMEDTFSEKTTLKENNPNGRSKEDSQQGG